MSLRKTLLEGAIYNASKILYGQSASQKHVKSFYEKYKEKEHKYYMSQKHLPGIVSKLILQFHTVLIDRMMGYENICNNSSRFSEECAIFKALISEFQHIDTQISAVGDLSRMPREKIIFAYFLCKLAKAKYQSLLERKHELELVINADEEFNESVGNVKSTTSSYDDFEVELIARLNGSIAAAGALSITVHLNKIAEHFKNLAEVHVALEKMSQVAAKQLSKYETFFDKIKKYEDFLESLYILGEELQSISKFEMDLFKEDLKHTALYHNQLSISDIIIRYLPDGDVLTNTCEIKESLANKKLLNKTFSDSVVECELEEIDDPGYEADDENEEKVVRHPVVKQAGSTIAILTMTKFSSAAPNNSLSVLRVIEEDEPLQAKQDPINRDEPSLALTISGLRL